MENLSLAHPSPCKFWPRVFALFFDSIILCVAGLLLGLAFHDDFAKMGVYGRLVGFGLSLGYFGILNSSIGGGQTLGKKACDIIVVRKDGKRIGLLSSLTRSTILLAPFFANGLPIAPSKLATFWGIALTILVFGFGFCIVYLYIANRRTRQSLHDLVIGSFVVFRNEEIKAEDNQKLNRLHFFVCGTFVVIILVFALFVGPSIAKKDTYVPLLETQKEIWSLDFVSYCQIGDSTTYSPSGKYTQFVVFAVVKKKENTGSEYIKRIIRSVFDNYPKVEDRDYLRITLSYGYDIGIAHTFSSQSRVDTIPHWKNAVYNEPSESDSN